MRRLFAWRVSEGGMADPRSTGMYAACWAAAPAPRAQRSSPERSVLLLSAGRSRSSSALALGSVPFRAVALLLTGAERAAPSLRSTRAVLAVAHQLVLLRKPPQLLLLTCSTQHACSTASHSASDAAHGGAWGFARVLRLEHVGLSTLSGDAPRGVRAPACLHELSAAVGSGAEAELAWSGSTRLAARLRRCDAGSASPGVPASSGAYAVTGGLGGLGLRAASLLLRGGVARVLLASRSGVVARGERGLAAQLRALGAAAAAVACDSAASSDLAALLARALPARGLLHASGVLRDKMLRLMATVDLRYS